MKLCRLELTLFECLKQGTTSRFRCSSETVWSRRKRVSIVELSLNFSVWEFILSFIVAGILSVMVFTGFYVSDVGTVA